MQLINYVELMTKLYYYIGRQNIDNHIFFKLFIKTLIILLHVLLMIFKINEYINE